MPRTLFIIIALQLFSLQNFGQCSGPPSQPGFINGFDPVCVGSSQTFFIFPVPGADDYTWVLPNGWTGFSTDTTITVTVGTTGGWIYVYANNSCGTSTPQGYLSQVMQADVTASSATTFCNGEDVVLNVVDNVTTTAFYQWYKDGVQIAGATSPTYTATIGGNYAATVITNLCMDTTAPIAVTVNPSPDIPIASSNSPVCSGATLNLSGACTTPGVVYNWTGPSSFTNTQNPVITNMNPQDAGIYNLTVVSTQGCSSTATTTVQFEQIPAAPAVIAGLNHICAGETTTYSILNISNANQYNWTLPNSWSGTSNTNSISATAGSAGGTISVNAENICGSGPAISLNVTIDPQPVPVIMQSGNVLTTTNTYSAYQWYWGTSPVAGATGQSFTPTQAGTYFVFVINSFGCSAQSAPVSFSPLAVENLEVENTSRVFPNPNSGDFVVDLGASLSLTESVSITITDITGRSVFSAETDQEIFHINLENSLPAGYYILHVISKDKTSDLYFIKE